MSQRSKTTRGREYQTGIRNVFAEIAWPVAVRAVTDPEWATQVAERGFMDVDAAICAQTDPDIFFTEYGEVDDATYNENIASARILCARCPLLTMCIENSLVTNPEHGIYGGNTSKNRNVLLLNATTFVENIEPQPAFTAEVPAVQMEQAA